MSSPRLRKTLGQHHLVDGGLTRPLIEFLAPAGQRVVEIGPGGGILTRELLRAGGSVLAIELDRDWAFELRRRLPAPALRLVIADGLALDWKCLPAPTLVAGNLPYNVATPLIARILGAFPSVPRAAFLVQKEVADRLVATAGDAAYGALSVLTAARSQPRILGRVRPGSFRPPPKVDSAFVGFTLREPPLPKAEMPAFDALVHAAFSQRRKTLRNSLGATTGREVARRWLEGAGIEAGRRAEELSLEEFLTLYRASRDPAPEPD